MRRCHCPSGRAEDAEADGLRKTTDPYTQTRPVWDCQSGLPIKPDPPGTTTTWPFLGRPDWQSGTLVVSGYTLDFQDH